MYLTPSPSCKQELDQVVEEVKKWWGGWDTETKWLEGAESKMADLRPLAGSVTLIKTQKEENEVLCAICSVSPQDYKEGGIEHFLKLFMPGR